MSKGTVYLSGPITGQPDFGRKAFTEGAARWRAAGWDVINPIEEDDKLGGPEVVLGQPYGKTLRRDFLTMLKDADAIAVLPGWTKSKGATREYNVARFCEMPVYDAVTMVELPGQQEPGNDSICAEAEALVFGDRRFAYGHPKENFEAIGRYWLAHLQNAILTRGPKMGWPVRSLRLAVEILERTFDPITDVAMMMVNTKQARELNSPKRDNWVDIAGYAEAGYQGTKKRTRGEEK